MLEHLGNDRGRLLADDLGSMLGPAPVWASEKLEAPVRYRGPLRTFARRGYSARLTREGIALWPTYSQERQGRADLRRLRRDARRPWVDVRAHRESSRQRAAQGHVTTYIDPIIAACIHQLDQLLPPGEWISSNDRQIVLAGPRRERLLNLVGSLPAHVVQAIGSRDVQAINSFLLERGHTIALRDDGSQALYAAAVLDLLVKWREPGAEKPLRLRDGSTVPGVEMRSGQFAAVGKVLMLPTQDADIEVWITEAASLEAGLARASMAACSDADVYTAYRNAMFPMLDFSEAVEIGWLMGMRKGDAVISQAVAQASLKLDHIGAHAKAAVAMAATRSITGSLTIAGPCVVAFMSVSCGDVIVAFHVGRDHFRKPVRYQSMMQCASPEASQ